MQFGKRSGYGSYPFLALALLLTPAALPAQNTADQQQAPQTTQQQSAQQTPAQRSEVLRQAQERVKARRRLRVEQIVQDTYTHKYEVYGGGGYLRFTPGSTLQHLNEAAWNAGFTDYFKGKIGITADFRGYYGTAFTYINQYQVFNPSISQYTFLAGPQVRLMEKQHWGISANALVGGGHGNFSTNTGGLPGTLIGLYPDGTTFNLSIGVPIDYNLGPTFAIRLTPNYLMTTYGSDVQNNLGWNIGVVWRFGRQ
ncbi:MAG TPA: hypothetical protein VE178_14205 [Silvibacterium sp.]|nr:hypothetical protein [Silvibacterium sp.]